MRHKIVNANPESHQRAPQKVMVYYCWVYEYITAVGSLLGFVVAELLQRDALPVDPSRASKH